jgi:LPS export ABC transporter protein LptC
MLFRLFTILTVIALGIITWIQSNPARAPAADAGAKQAERPGYYLRNSVLTDYDADGAPSIRIAAKRIDQVGHGSEVALHNVQVDYQAPDGIAWVMVGDEAHVEPGGKTVEVTGNVRLEGSEAGHKGSGVFLTDALTYDVAGGIASTKSDVRIEFGDQTLTARGLVANLRDRTYHLESRVSGRFHP